jgi:hypothetical protein
MDHLNSIEHALMGWLSLPEGVVKVRRGLCRHCAAATVVFSFWRLSTRCSKATAPCYQWACAAFVMGWLLQPRVLSGVHHEGTISADDCEATTCTHSSNRQTPAAVHQLHIVHGS